MAGPSLTLHIGLPKTGTTYLQEAVFPRIPALRYLGKLGTDRLQAGGGPRYGILDRTFKQSTAIWNDHGAALFDDHIGAAPSPATARLGVLVSDEGMGTSGRRPEHLALHLERLTDEAARRGFARVRVLCTIRRQDQWLGSHYAQISDRQTAVSQARFEAFVRGALDPWDRFYHDGIMLDYAHLHATLGRAVGPDNVLFLPFEQFLDAPATYLERLLDFLDPGGATTLATLGLDRNDAGRDRYNRRSAGADRWAVRPHARTVRLRPARLFAALGLPTTLPLRLPDPSRPRHIVMTDDLRRAVLDVYAPRNAALARAAGLDLTPYGYH